MCNMLNLSRNTNSLVLHTAIYVDTDELLISKYEISLLGNLAKKLAIQSKTSQTVIKHQKIKDADQLLKTLLAFELKPLLGYKVK